MAWRGPEYPGEFPTLGFDVLDWVAEWLIVPDGPLAGEPLILTPEQAQFVIRFYRIDQATGKRAIRRGVLSRPKGWGKSPLLAALCIAEAIAPVVPDGWDSSGEPVGRPWVSLGFKAKAEILGVSEDQTANTWDPLLDMIREGPLVNEPGVEPMETFVNVPRGRIECRTSAASSREGFRPIFDVFDQTESWVASNGGKKLAAAVRRNLTKTGGSSVETPNSFRPGFESVAEDSYKAWQLQQAGKLKNGDGILFDHREAPADTDIADRESMLAGLRFAYGCSVDAPCALAELGEHEPHEPGWAQLPRVLADFWDPSTDPADGRMYFLNQITSASDAWLAQHEWLARRVCNLCIGIVTDPEAPTCVHGGPVEVGAREPVVIGFDGSKSRKRGTADATALVACRVSDGHLWLIKAWEQPDGPAGDEWEVPALEVDAAVHDTFGKLNVVGFYADPAKWESYVATWEAKYHARLKVKAGAKHPIEWWINHGRSLIVTRAIDKLHTAIIDGQMTHDGGYVLTRHMLNARRRKGPSGIWIGKDHPDSSNKVDAAWASVAAYAARIDAVAAGIGSKPAGYVKRVR